MADALGQRVVDPARAQPAEVRDRRPSPGNHHQVVVEQLSGVGHEPNKDSGLCDQGVEVGEVARARQAHHADSQDVAPDRRRRIEVGRRVGRVLGVEPEPVHVGQHAECRPSGDPLELSESWLEQAPIPAEAVHQESAGPVADPRGTEAPRSRRTTRTRPRVDVPHDDGGCTDRSRKAEVHDVRRAQVISAALPAPSQTTTSKRSRSCMCASTTTSSSLLLRAPVALRVHLVDGFAQHDHLAGRVAPGLRSTGFMIASGSTLSRSSLECLRVPDLESFRRDE